MGTVRFFPFSLLVLALAPSAADFGAQGRRGRTGGGEGEIPLEGFGPGNYRLTVLVRDEVSGKALERRAGFRAIP